MHLELNPSKFNFIYLSRSKSFPFSFSSVTIFSDLTIYLSSTVRSLGYFLDSSLSFEPQILSVSSFCFYHLRRLSFHLGDASLKILVCSFVLSRLDYCNSLYYNLLKASFYPLTKAFNSAARLFSNTLIFFHIFPSLTDLHSLPFHFHSSFKICSLMHRISQANSLFYLSNLLLLPKRAGPRFLPASSPPLSFLLIPTLKLLFLSLVHFSRTLFLRISNLILILFFFKSENSPL